MSLLIKVTHSRGSYDIAIDGVETEGVVQVNVTLPTTEQKNTFVLQPHIRRLRDQADLILSQMESIERKTQEIKENEVNGNNDEHDGNEDEDEVGNDNDEDEHDEGDYDNENDNDDNDDNDDELPDLDIVDDNPNQLQIYRNPTEQLPSYSNPEILIPTAWSAVYSTPWSANSTVSQQIQTFLNRRPIQNRQPIQLRLAQHPHQEPNQQHPHQEPNQQQQQQQQQPSQQQQQQQPSQLNDMPGLIDEGPQDPIMSNILNTIDRMFRSESKANQPDANSDSLGMPRMPYSITRSNGLGDRFVTFSNIGSQSRSQYNFDRICDGLPNIDQIRINSPRYLDYYRDIACTIDKWIIKTMNSDDVDDANFAKCLDTIFVTNLLKLFKKLNNNQMRRLCDIMDKAPPGETDAERTVRNQLKIISTAIRDGDIDDIIRLFDTPGCTCEFCQ